MNSPNNCNQDLINDWERKQKELKSKLILSDTEVWAHDLNQLELIGGLDISYDNKNDSKGCVSCVVLDIKNDFNIVYKNCTNITISTPYIAGFLAFREIDFLVKEVELLKQNQPKLLPQIWLIDGNGQLHPRQCGLASHFGVLTDSPAIGVAKNPYFIELIDNDIKEMHKKQVLKLEKSGDQFPILNKENQLIGVCLKTRVNCKRPVYVSIGNRVSLNTAIIIVLKCCKYKIPEPIRMADIISRQYLNKY